MAGAAALYWCCPETTPSPLTSWCVKPHCAAHYLDARAACVVQNTFVSSVIVCLFSCSPAVSLFISIGDTNAFRVFSFLPFFYCLIIFVWHWLKFWCIHVVFQVCLCLLLRVDLIDWKRQEAQWAKFSFAESWSVYIRSTVKCWNYFEAQHLIYLLNVPIHHIFNALYCWEVHQ